MQTLLTKIMERIRREREIMTIRRRLLVFSLLAILASITFVLLLPILQSGLVASGFSYFLALIFTDFNLVMADWQNFSLSLLETIPALSLAISALIFLVFLGAIHSVVSDLKLVFKENLVKL